MAEKKDSRTVSSGKLNKPSTRPTQKVAKQNVTFSGPNDEHVRRAGERQGAFHGGARPKSKNLASRPSPRATPAGQSGMNMERALVPKGDQRLMRAGRGGGGQVQRQQGLIVPKGYTARPVIPAKKAELISVARAMNDDFAGKVKTLFDPEREAALAAIRTGVYIGWRCPEFTWDCIRVGDMSKCFCGHLLNQHAQYTGRSVKVKCVMGGCECKAFAFVPGRPEDVGEFWFQRRRDFDPSTWRAKCRCKHPHDQHSPNSYKPCKAKGCRCSQFESNFLCAACDRHWEDHETLFETEDMRRQAGIPCGQEYLPFAEMPDLRNIVLTGKEDDDSPYRALTEGEGAIPRALPFDNNTPVQFGGQKKPGFKPVYD
ncbi:protein FAM221B-like [Branchiostoma lanceolatum]|uniref:protein FAM221B-like n=1 Tax=Branchiostoma lanceolatum TaxID=7740 RepID=UPI003451F199